MSCLKIGEENANLSNWGIRHAKIVSDFVFSNIVNVWTTTLFGFHHQCLKKEKNISNMQGAHSSEMLY